MEDGKYIRQDLFLCSKHPKEGKGVGYMKKKIFSSILGLFVGAILATQSSSLTLYDDFSGTSIDKLKWKQGEWVREIRDGKLALKQASPNPMVVTSYPFDYESNELRFSDPNSVNSIQSDVTVLEYAIINSAMIRARLGGNFYNDGTPGGGNSGDIYAEIDLRDEPDFGPSASCFVYKYPDLENSGKGEVVWIKRLPIPSITGSTYTLYIEYDSMNHRFIFRGGTEEVIVGPSGLPPRDRYPNIPYKVLSTGIRINDGSSSGYVSATFDNVYKNGTLYDNFSSPTIDSARWTTYEFVREISGGKLRSKVRTSSASTSTIDSNLEFLDPVSINAIQAKITPLSYQNDQGTHVRARVDGSFYNDGTPGGGIIGEVGAQVRIAGREDNPFAEWNVSRIADLAGNDEKLAEGTFTTPITLGNTYALFLGWDGSQFTIRIDDEEAHYKPTTRINPSKYPWKEIGTHIKNPAGTEATIEALFDDVMVEQVVEDIALSAPLNGSVFDCCSLSTPPIFGWSSEESFKGYEIQFSLNQGFSSIPVKTKVKVNESTNEAAFPAASWKKVMTMPGTSGGTVYWRVQGKRANGTTGLSEVFWLGIDPSEAVGNPALSPTSKSALPVLSWTNNCDTKFKVWFGSDESLTKKVPYSFTVKNPNEDGGVFSQGLASAQWKAVRKLVNDVVGSTIYWYVESWDGLNRYSKTDVMSFDLTD